MKKTSILFICHGNICRSPMAEFIFKDMVRKAGREEEYIIASAAVSREELGNNMYAPARDVLRAHGVPFGKHRAHQVTEQEMREYDLIIIMDESNLHYLRRMFGGRYLDKVRMLMEYTGCIRSVSDPWYTDDFETAYADILCGCRALLSALQQ